MLFDPGACCDCSTTPTGVQVTVQVGAPCAFVPGETGTIVVKRNGSVVATAPFAIPAYTPGALFGDTASAVFSLPNGSGYTAELASDPARFTKRAPFAFTVPIFGPATRFGLGADVHPDYVCFLGCRGVSGPSPPPLPRTLTITDSVYGTATLTYNPAGTSSSWIGTASGAVSPCGCDTAAPLGYQWPQRVFATSGCEVGLSSQVRSDGCHAYSPLPDSIINGRFTITGTPTYVSVWPLVMTFGFTAPGCDRMNMDGHMPYPPGASVAYEITE